MCTSSKPKAVQQIPVAPAATPQAPIDETIQKESVLNKDVEKKKRKGTVNTSNKRKFRNDLTIPSKTGVAIPN